MRRRMLLCGSARPPAPTVGRLTASGPYFADAAGQIVIRRSITAFTLPKRYATGRADDANRYLDWVASEGFNEVRAFASVDWTGPPGSGVESGWAYDAAACRETIAQAAARGLRTELVALTYTGSPDALVARLQPVDALCTASPSALLECANEPSRNDIDIAAVLARYTPQTPSWASGQATPVPLSQPALTYHSPRKPEWSRCFKDAYEFGSGQGPETTFAPPFGGPVMLDEPPQVEQTIRDHGAALAIDDWRAYGAGAAFFAAGATLHGNPGFQRCEVPTDPTVLACVRAFIAGLGDVPLQRYTGYNRGTPPGSDPGSRRYWRWSLTTGQQYEICVRPYSFTAV